MFKLLGGLKDYLKWQEITTDNAIFRLHNSFTTVLLMACSLVITATQYVGTPIQCIVNGLPTHPINTYCWITSTFTMPDAFRRQVGVEVAHPGVSNDFGDEDAKKYYTYYQWVCFVLFFQAILCYTPKFIWDAWEGGLLRTIIMGLNIGMCHEEEKNKKKKTLIDYLLRHIQMKSDQRSRCLSWFTTLLWFIMPFMSVMDERHNYYAMRYWFCECLCLVNIILQLYFMNRFFDGEFLQYGLKVMAMSEDNQESRYDPMVYIFPRVTKCTFHKYGASGTIQKHDSLCILPLNIVNEKTYIFIWFWFMILLSLLSLLVVYRVLIICCPSIRPRLLRARNRMVPHEVASAICRKVDIGDWWILYMLGRNMDPLIYREMIMELVKKIETHASNQ